MSIKINKATPYKKKVLKFLTITSLIFVCYSLLIKYYLPYRQDQFAYKFDLANIEYTKEIYSYLKVGLKDRNNSEKKILVFNSKDVKCDINNLPSLSGDWSYSCIKDKNDDIASILDVDKLKDRTILVTYKNKNFCVAIQNKNNKGENFALPGYTAECSLGNIFSEAYGFILDIDFQSMNNLNLKDKVTDKIIAEIKKGIISEGNQVTLDGSDFMTINNSNSTELIGTSDFDYSIILNFKTNQSADQSLTEKWIGNKYPFSIRGPFPGIQFALYDGKENPSILSNKNYADDKWHQVIVVRDTKNKKMILYADGLMIDSIKDTTDLDISNRGDFPLGARNILGEKLYKGSIGKFTILNKIISTKEAQNIFRTENF